MEEREEEDGAAAELVHLRGPPDPGDSRRIATEQLGGEVAERADHLRLDQPHLFEEVGLAGLDLKGWGSRLPGGRLFSTLAMKTSSRESPISSSIWLSSWPARPTKGKPLPVLFGPGRLADEHQVGVGVAGAENGLGPRLVQRALVQP